MYYRSHADRTIPNICLLLNNIMAVESSLVLQTFHYEPRDTAAQRWTRWLPRLENFLLAAAIEKPERQKAMLLHHIDDELFAIYSTLTVPPPGDQQTVYTCAQQALTNFFSPKRNVEFELFRFRQAEQQVGEDLDSFYSRLKQLAINCNFQNQDAELKSQIIQKCLSTKLREEGMSKADISLADLLKFGCTLESSKRQAKAMEEKLTRPPPQVNRLGQSEAHKFKGKHNTQKPKDQATPNTKKNPAKTGSSGKKNKTCYNFGGKWPHPQGRHCPAYGKKCGNCGRYNHFASLCSQRSVHHLKDDSLYYESEVLDEYGDMYHVTSDETESQNAYHVNLKINGVETVFEVDTGAAVSVMKSLIQKPNLV